MTNEALIPFHTAISGEPGIEDLDLGETLRFKKGGGQFELMEADNTSLGKGFRLLIDGNLYGLYFGPAQFFKFIFPQKETA